MNDTPENLPDYVHDCTVVCPACQCRIQYRGESLYELTTDAGKRTHTQTATCPIDECNATLKIIFKAMEPRAMEIRRQGNWMNVHAWQPLVLLVGKE